MLQQNKMGDETDEIALQLANVDQIGHTATCCLKI